MCDYLTYRSAGAETLVRMDTINILLRWSKEGVLGYVGTAFVQLNSPDEPISYIRTHVNLFSLIQDFQEKTLKHQNAIQKITFVFEKKRWEPTLLRVIRFIRANPWFRQKSIEMVFLG